MSGATTRQPADNDNPQVQAESSETHSQKAADWGWNPFHASNRSRLDWGSSICMLAMSDDVSLTAASSTRS
jgi:hypothetical protein